MQQQITRAEFVRLLLALLMAVVIYLGTGMVGGLYSAQYEGVGGFVAFLFFDLFAPAFLAVLIATLVPSWRYKLVAATLMLCGTTILGLLELALAPLDFMVFTAYAVRLSALMTGALLAAYIWRIVKRRRDQKQSPPAFVPTPATALPTTSPLLMGLSLVSIPLTYITLLASAFLVLGYSAFLLILIFELPGVPFVLMIIAVLAPLAAGWVSLRALMGLLWRRRPFLPAQSISWHTRPLLNAAIEEVCGLVGTRPPDNVILTIQPTFFVTQQPLRVYDKKVRGRTLAIGMPLLPLLTEPELKAILAHEFAHFAGRDTAYTIWVAPVYHSMEDAIIRMQRTMEEASTGAQAMMSYLLYPSLLALIICYEFFATIDKIISRSREFRADWIAASHYGSDNVVSSLKKIVPYGKYFSGQQEYFMNVPAKDLRFHYRLAVPLRHETLQKYWDEAVNLRAHEFDSHPTLPMRIGNLPGPPLPIELAPPIVAAQMAAGNGPTGSGEMTRAEVVTGEVANGEVVNAEETPAAASTAPLQQELDDEIAQLIANYENMIIKIQNSVPRYI